MAKKLFIGLVTAALLAGLLFGLPSAALATAVDRMALCNLEGYPGETVEAQITLQGTEAEERSGYWYTHYKETEGDDARMDITPWITIVPAEYAITQGESITFTIRVAIPADAAPGLWGATSEEAGLAGHSGERRTYLIFKDTPTGGNVYSGLLIPVSVLVLGEAPPEAGSTEASEAPTTPAGSTEASETPATPAESGGETSLLDMTVDYVKDNLIVVILGVVIIILLIVLIARTRARRAY